MRTRAAVLAAVVAFAVAVAGVAVVAARSGGGSGLERLPFAATGAERGDAAMSLSAPAGALEYALAGTLPDLPDEAPAYRLGTSGDAGEVVAALGVAADTVTVERVPGSPWYLASAKPDVAVSSCPVYPVAPDGPPVAQPEIGSCLGGSPVPSPVAGLPSKAEAERIARDVFAKLDVSAEGLELLGGTYSWDAVASPSVGGLPTRGLETGLSIGPGGGITGAHGFLGRPERIGDYPLVGAAAGFERLKQGVGIGPQPLAARDIAVNDVARQVVTVTGARLALLHIGELLVPVYEFATDAGGALTAPAVTDRWLAEHEPQTIEPAPVPRLDVDRGSGSCSASAAGASTDGGKGGVTVQVCVEPARAKVGEEVAFTVTVYDPEAPIVAGGCNGPQVSFGDDVAPTGRVECAEGCSAPPSGPPPGKRQGDFDRVYRHAYAAAGTYTARFVFNSGGLCGNAYSSSGEGTITVEVE